MRGLVTVCVVSRSSMAVNTDSAIVPRPSKGAVSAPSSRAGWVKSSTASSENADSNKARSRKSWPAPKRYSASTTAVKSAAGGVRDAIMVCLRGGRLRKDGSFEWRSRLQYPPCLCRRENRPVSAFLVHDPRSAGDANRTAGRGRNFGMQTRAHAHILALQNVDDASVRPPDIAQVTGKRGRPGTSRRIFVDTTGCKRIARVEPLRRLGPGEQDRDEAGPVHQVAAHIEVVSHSRQDLPRFQNQREVIGAAVDDRGWNTRIEVLGRVAEQRERVGHQWCGGRHAAGGRRLQRGGHQVTTGARFDRDVRLVEGERENAVAMLQRKRRAQCDRRMTAEGHLRFRREITYPPTRAYRRRKSGFGEIDLGGDSLHRADLGKLAAQRDTSRIAARVAVGKSGNFQDIHGFLPG